MPDSDASTTRRMRVWAVVLLLALAAALLWWWPRPDDAMPLDTNAGVSFDDVVLGTGPTHPSPGATHASAAVPTAPSLASAPLLTHDQWQKMQRTLAAENPDAQAADREAARILSFMAFQRDVTRWRVAQAADPHSAQARTLAAMIDAQIDLRLASRELSGPQASRLKAAMLTSLIDGSDAERQQALTQWTAQTLTKAPPAVDPRDEAFAQAQAAALAQWRSDHPGEIPDQQFFDQLDTLRQRTYAAP